MDEILKTVGPIFRHEWVVFPLFGISVFFAVYMYADKVINKVQNSSVQNSGHAYQRLWYITAFVLLVHHDS